MLAIILMFYSAHCFASAEHYSPWQSVRIETAELHDIGSVSIEATVKENKITFLKISAFERIHILTEDELKKIEHYPLSSIQITDEAGYKQLGGRSLHCRFKRIYYNDKKDLIQEDGIITVRKFKPDEVFINTRNKILKKGNEPEALPYRENAR